LSACHFGRSAEEMRPTFEEQKRVIEYKFSVGLPFANSVVSSIEDFGTDGMKMNWNEQESLAVFSSAFVMESDTLLGEDAKPKVVQLKYDARRDGSSGIVGNIKTLDFSFESWARHGEGEACSQLVPILYPYSKVLSEDGTAPKASVDSLLFNFNGQDGELQHLRDSFFVAMGMGVGVVEKACGTIRTDSSEYVKLTPKFAILRIGMVVPADNTVYTLNRFIKSRCVSESVRYIDAIEITNENEEASGFNRTILDLSTGEMRASENAQHRLVLSSNSAFTKLDDCPYTNFIPLSPLGSSSVSWGTLLYLAIPCPDQGTLDFSGVVDVVIVEQMTGEKSHLYGRLAPVTLNEGNYYLTSAMPLYNSLDEINEAAEVLFVPDTGDNNPENWQEAN